MSDDREVTEIRIGVIGSVDSGKSLPFAELPNALKQKRKKEEEN